MTSHPGSVNNPLPFIFFLSAVVTEQFLVNTSLPLLFRCLCLTPFLRFSLLRFPYGHLSALGGLAVA